MTALDSMGSLGPLAAEGRPGRNLQAVTSTSAHRPSASGIGRTERSTSTSFRFREFERYDSTSRIRANYSNVPDSSLTTTTKPTSDPFPFPARGNGPLTRSNHDPSYSAPYPARAVDEEDWPAYATSYTPFPTSRFSVSTNDTSSILELAPASPTPSPPRSPVAALSPRWDSLGYSRPVPYTHAQYAHAPGIALSTPLAVTSPTSPTPTRRQHTITVGSLASELRDEFDFPLPSPLRRANMIAPESQPVGGDSMLVGNFSRPRRPSIKHASPDPSLRYRPGNSPPSRSNSPHPDTLNTPNQYLLARERGQSISSNKSTSTFASLPVRPSPDLYYRDSVRGRSRNAHPPLARQPMLYNRAESSGHSFPRDPIPRMASMPSDELRSSFRSQLSASTTPGTVQTERSSVLTKSSSITSICMPVDDGFSVDDVMGIYEKGFRDDSPGPADFPDDDSRPPTAKSERNRRRTALLEAFSDSLPVEGAFAEEEDGNESHSNDLDTEFDVQAPVPSTANPAEIRDSTAIFGLSTSAPVDLAEETPASRTEHDQRELGDDGDDDFPVRPRQTKATQRTSIENTDITRDRYGFRKQNQYVTQEQYDSWNEGYSEYMERRRRKWQAYMKESGLITDDPIRFPQRSAKTKRFVRKGIPPEWRGAAWFYYAGGPAILAKHGGVYDQLLRQEAKDIDKEAIERDLHRTFPDNVKFRAADASSAPNTEHPETRSSQATLTETNGNAARPDETQMISSLRHVLHAFSIYNPKIGYCQSLNFLAGLLLLFTETEEQAFWLLNIITRVYLPGTHETSLEGANVDLGVLMTSVQETMPAVWAKIGGELDGTDAVKPKSRRNRKGAIPIRLPPVTLCMTAWFMSCFIGTLPIETTLRVWDAFFYEGSKTLFRIALTIFKQGEQEIKSVGDPMEIFQVVQAMPRRLLDANALMEACFRRRNGFGHISQDTIEERRMERRKNVKLENERIATGLTDDATDFKRKNLFGKKRRPAELL
ncbi:hypothetical protein SUNI508_05444 [Seiridium unicorne]|uniref:Rab-GAP TBC domain-containing protein n=1 Tax=Seiridium unicorne TaxID=138068 RepID=A0ABR2V5E6_9PEZI